MIPNCAIAFLPLCDAIHHQFHPAVLGGPVSEFEVQLFDFPARAGGLAISDPVKYASVGFFSSLQSSAVHRAAISEQAEFSPTAYLDLLDAIRLRPQLLEESIPSLLYWLCYPQYPCLHVMPLRGLLTLEFLAG